MVSWARARRGRRSPVAKVVMRILKGWCVLFVESEGICDEISGYSFVLAKFECRFVFISWRSWIKLL